MKILVVGGAGYIGGFLTDHLRKNNHKVTVVGPDGILTTTTCRDAVQRTTRATAKTPQPPRSLSAPAPIRAAIRPWTEASHGARAPASAASIHNARCRARDRALLQRRVEEVGGTLQVPSHRVPSHIRIADLTRRIRDRATASGNPGVS